MKTKLLLLFSLISLSGFAQTIPSYVPTNGLIAYYPFDNNANDVSGNQNNGTVNGAILTEDRNAKPNSAYSFNGINNYIDAIVTNIPKNNAPRTISGWFKTNTPNTGENQDVCIFNYGTLSKLQRVSLTIYSKAYLQSVTGPDFTSDDFYVNNYNYLNNDWYFFALTYDGTKVSLYVNGIYVSGNTINLNTTNNLFRIGKRISGDTTNEYFKGTIDDLGIWNRALTPKEISALYTPGKPPVSYTLIPDINFEKKLIELGIDSGVVDGKVLTSDIASVGSLDISSSSISDLTGIQDFTNLQALYFQSNSITSVDLSKNTKLIGFNGQDNKITSINLSGNNLLQQIHIDRNNLISLDITQCTSLFNLNCEDNKLESVNLSQNKKLSSLFLDRNSLTTLDISKNTALQTVWCGENQLSTVVLPESNNLDVLYLNDNKLTALNISKYTNLKQFVCSTNQLTSIDISNNTQLTYFHCQSNNLTSLNVTKNIGLTSIYCFSNQIKTLDLSQNKNLETLWCNRNQLSSLDVSQNSALLNLSCYGNNFINLNVKNGNNANMNIYTNGFTNNPNLTCIQVDDVTYANTNWSSKKDLSANFNTNCNDGYTLIPDLNFEKALIAKGIDSGIPDGRVLTSKVASVTELYFMDKSISSLSGIQDFKSIKILYLDGNQLTNIDISNNTTLEHLSIGDNQLKDLDTSKNIALKSLYFHNNQIDSINVSKNTVLEWLYLSENRITDLNVSKNTALVNLTCSSNLLTTLDLSQNTALTHLICDHNQLPELDVSKNTLLEGLECNSNKLTTLNTSKNSNLVRIECDSNKITRLDTSNNLLLSGLNCNSNLLTTLDISKNTALNYLKCASNQLISLNLKNGNNTIFINTTMVDNLKNNPNLSCIQVDDAAYANKKWMDAKDSWATYNTTCTVEYVALPDANFEQKLIDLGIDTDGLNGKITIADASSITNLDLSNSNIKNLTGIEYFTSLTTLDISNNQITSLDVSNNLLLETLNVSSNQLTTLDLSKNTKLTIVYVVNNPLVYLNLRNGNNTNFILPSNTGKKSASGLYTTFLGLTSLSCIQVDDENYSNANWSNIKESTTTYSNTCKSLGIDKSEFSQIIVYPNPTKGEITINNIALDKATVYNSVGKLVKSFTLNNANTNNTIDLSGLPRGIYYVYLINEDAASAKKVIVE